jgi:hypothetical protein
MLFGRSGVRIARKHSCARRASSLKGKLRASVIARAVLGRAGSQLSGRASEKTRSSSASE